MNGGHFIIALGAVVVVLFVLLALSGRPCSVNVVTKMVQCEKVQP